MTRPLPELNPQNEFFWTAGADGVLRIQECKDCDALIHPPQPVCRYCRSRNMGVRNVSGEATLSAFTVNHRFGFPDLPPPYVVAQVAIVEDPRVRLTTTQPSVGHRFSSFVDGTNHAVFGSFGCTATGKPNTEGFTSLISDHVAAPSVDLKIPL